MDYSVAARSTSAPRATGVCSYRDLQAEFAQLGAMIVGVSAQSAAEQAEFAAREHIPFPPDRDAAQVLAWLRS